MDKNTVKILADIALSSYVGMRCHYCGHVYNSVEDIDSHNVIRDYDHDGEFSICCKRCFPMGFNQIKGEK